MSRAVPSWRDAFLGLLALTLAMLGWWLIQLSGDVRALKEEVAVNRSAILNIDRLETTVQDASHTLALHEERLAALKEHVKALLEAR